MRNVWLTSGLVAAILTPVPALAAPAPAKGREVIVLFHQPSGEPPRGESLPTATEAVLNHLGYVARYHEVANGLPDAALSTRARGVVSVLEDNAVPDPAALLGWLDGQMALGKPVVLMTGLSPLRNRPNGTPVASEAGESIMERLGVTEVESSGPVTPVAGPHAPFEAPWSATSIFSVLENHLPANEAVWPLKGRAGQALAYVGPRGAIAVDLAAVRAVNPLTYRMCWRVDPFWLLGRTLRRAGEPALDTTTLNGRRIFYAHIDGDGFSNGAVRRGGPLAAEVMRDEVLRRTWLPTTVSVIAKELAGDARREAIARSIYAMPQVAAGSHSYTHPHDWALGTMTTGAGGDDGTGTAKTVKVTLSPRHEIDDAAVYIQGLLPAGKHMESMLWSGATNPTAAFLERTEAFGLANLNGGDATLDEAHPSYANLAPLARQVGPYLQVYASSANENLFTNLWTGPFDGQLAALKLYQFAEKPRRMAPVNIYYHFYAAERLAGLKALQTLYRWAEAQPLCHLSVAGYTRVVTGFYTGRVESDGPGSWSVADAGGCRTLRFDRETRRPDLAASSGVAGWNTANGSLYVHLTGPSAHVVLRAAEGTPAGARPSPAPYLQEASAPLASWGRRGHALTAVFDAEAPMTVVLAGFGKGQAVRVNGFAGAEHADGAGRLTLTAAAGRRRLEVRW